MTIQTAIVLLARPVEHFERQLSFRNLIKNKIYLPVFRLRIMENSFNPSSKSSETMACDSIKYNM